ncbi:MAG: hypothetical protein HFI12_10310 [Lachnospiraceae bacterium]|jgi:multidrug efflux pump subunit AcrA (membrane-fusion protein)|nr:hypothetical protein [Lachnospiraceae bacterium]
MELWKKQKKIGIAFVIFLTFMLLCTLISRVVYVSKLPQVTVSTPQRMAINHHVEADGIVHQGREYAVTALSGLRVKTVYANVGDRVEPSTLLFELDMEDLKTQIQERELEIKKLQLQTAAMEQNRYLDTQREGLEDTRAAEDYTRAEGKSEEALNRAKEDLDKAEDDYDTHTEKPVKTTSKAEREAQEAAYEAWARREAELKSALERAQASLSQNALKDPEVARTELEKAQTAYDEHLKKEVKKPDFAAEDQEKSAWKEKKQSLEDAVTSAERALEDAERSRTDNMLEAGRKVEDTSLPSNVDNTIEINQLEIQAMQTKLAAYQKALESGGQIYPEASGIVTRIQVSPGERIADGAAIVYADLESPMQFRTSITKEQKKYVNQGDMVQLDLGSSDQELPVDYVAENEVNPELYDVHMFLPDGIGTIGQSGSFQLDAQSDTFPCCIPITALYEDSNRRTFVYIVSERAGILGSELVAEMVYVRVLDQNNTYAALEEGLITRETEIIVHATEAIEDRDVIRYQE